MTKVLFTSYLCSIEEPLVQIILNDWKKLNSNFDIKYFSDNDVYNFFKNTKYFDTYKKLKNGVAIADFFRICYIYENGGYWFDIDIQPFKVDIPNECNIHLFDAGYKNISYMFIGGNKKNKLYEDVIEEVSKRINNNYKIKKQHIMEITGPRIIQKLVFDKLKIKNKDGCFPSKKKGYNKYLENTDYEFTYKYIHISNKKIKLYKLLKKKYKKLPYQYYNFI